MPRFRAIRVSPSSNPCQDVQLLLTPTYTWSLRLVRSGSKCTFPPSVSQHAAGNDHHLAAQISLLCFEHLFSSSSFNHLLRQLLHSRAFCPQTRNIDSIASVLIKAFALQILLTQTRISPRLLDTSWFRLSPETLFCLTCLQVGSLDLSSSIAAS